MATAEFRLATVADENEVWALWRACAADDRCLWNDDYPTPDFLHSDLNHGWLYVMLSEGRLQGAVTLMPTDDLEDLGLPFAETEKVAVMTRLCVWPALQGQGYGRRLLALTERHAAAGGAKAMHMLCDVRNAPALALYRRAGYRQVSDARLYGDHFFVLERVFSDGGAL